MSATSENNLNIEIQHKLIEKLTETNRELRLVNSFSKLIQEGRGFNDLILSLLERFSETYSFTKVQCFELDRNDMSLVQRFEMLCGESPYKVLNAKRLKLDGSYLSEVAITGRYIQTQSINVGIPNRLIIPVKHHEIGVVGILSIECLSDCAKPNLNIDTIHTVTDMLASKLVELVQLDQIKNYQRQLEEYVHVVSHDLKAPLRSLSALNSWVKEDLQDEIPTTVHQHFDRIDEVLEHMESLITNTLKYSRLDHEQEEPTSVNVANLVNQVVNSMVVPSNFELHLDENLPVINGHETKLKQVFQNLLGNAFKFNDKEHGRVELNYRQTDYHHLFEVKDNGIGVEEKYYTKIFDVFQSLEKKNGSTGVGLSIVKKIIEQMGGKVCIDSIPAQYTSIHFSLPHRKV